MNSAVPRAGRGARELQRVADVVGELDDFVALVVMAEDDDAVAERRLAAAIRASISSSDRREVALGQRLPLADARLLDRRVRSLMSI